MKVSCKFLKNYMEKSTWLQLFFISKDLHALDAPVSLSLQNDDIVMAGVGKWHGANPPPPDIQMERQGSG